MNNSSATSASHFQHNLTEFSSTTIVSSDGISRPYFPDIARCANEDLLVSYYWNVMHAPIRESDAKGVIRIIRSRDNALTWEAPQTVIDFRSSNLDCRDPNLFNLPDGTILLTFFTYSYSEEHDHKKSTQTYICRSQDHGQSWSAPDLLANSNLWNAKQGTMALLDNEDLLMVTYGSQAYNADIETYRLVCMRSTDSGLTWSGEVEIAESAPGHSLNEACLVNMGQYGVYCLAREYGDLFVSHDNGCSWEKQGEVDPVQRPHFLKIDNDRVFTSWCDPSGFAISQHVNRKVMGKVFDLRFGWNATQSKTIYDPLEKGLADMGYPSSVHFAEKQILTIYYDSRIGVIAGNVTDLNDWGKSPLI